MNIPLKEKLREIAKYSPPILLLLIGFYYLVIPILSGWLEVVSPWIYRKTLLWADAIAFMLALAKVNIEYVMLVFYGLSLLYYLRKHNQFTRNLDYMWRASIVFLPILFIITFSFGFSYFERSRSAFPLGGHTLVFLAGGPDNLRAGAKELLVISNDESPPRPTWPESIRLLNGYVKLDKQFEYVLVGHGHSFNMSEEFGIIITLGETLPENIDLGTVWEIEDNIYLFSR